MDINVNLKVGDNEVIASGSVIGDPQQPIVFELQNLRLKMDFENDKENPEQQVSIKNISSTELDLNFRNFNNPTGTGNKAPINLGTLGGGKLYFNYRIYALNDEVGKVVHYTFYIQKEEAHK